MPTFLKKRRTATDGAQTGPNPSRGQRFIDATKTLLDIANESSDAFPPLKSCLGGINALIKYYEGCKDVEENLGDLVLWLTKLKNSGTTTGADDNQKEAERRELLTRSLKSIEERSQRLLDKGKAARILDQRRDSGAIVKLVEELRQAILLYQLSQQRSIDDQVTQLTSSFNAFLKLDGKSPGVKEKIESALAKFGRLTAEMGATEDKGESKRRLILFEALEGIKDDLHRILNRSSADGYKENEADTLAVCELAEDVKDAIFEYQFVQQTAMFEQNRRLIDSADLSVLNNCRRAQAAEYRHGNRRGCLKGTRDTVLNEIESWANDPHKSPVFWLNGLAGTGKTTIAQTIAERFFAEGRLGASFFCSRDSEDRSNLHFIFPTLAFQLSHKYPDFRSLFVSLLHSNPDVIHESLYNQMQTLITEPLREIGVSTVIVIDALDECKDDEPSSAILSVLARFVEEMPEAKFFITGRPEPRIKTGFRLPLLVDSTDVFVLHDVHPSLVENDIRIYLKHELSELAQRRQLEGWPSNEHVNLLCSRAAGLFVYAVATVKFLDSATHLTEHRFNVILNLPEGTTPEGKTRFNSKTTLDSLYTSILQTAFPEEDPEVDLKVRTTLGAIVTVVNPLPPPAIARLIRLESKEVMLYLTLIQSLLAIDEDPNRPVRPFHKSFPDFITDPLRCVDTRFYISPAPVHLQLAMNCLGLMNDKLEQNLLSLPEYSLNSEVKDLQTRIDDRVSIALQYACRSWHSHLTETRGESAGFIPYLRIFLEEKFLAWLEVLSVLSDVGSASAGLEKLMDWLKEVAEDSHLLDTARDCFRFVTKFFEPISVSATHIYHSALELCPISSIVRKLYYNRSHGLTHVPRVMVGTPDSWDTKISISGKHDYTFGTWSPCGQFIAAHTEETIEIRNHLTFELLTSLPSNNYTSPTWGPLAYSPDGRSLACGFSNAIIIWDIQTGGVAKKIKCGGDVISLVWSLDGERISTELCYKTSIRGVEMYDIVSGAQLFAKEFEERSTLYLWACEKSFGLLEVAFPSPNFTLKISSSVISTSEIVTNSFRIESFRAVEGVQPTALTFSPSTHHILVFDDYKHYCVFDIRTSDCLLDCSSHAYYSQFSPDGSLLAIGNGRIIHMYKCTPGHYTNLGEITFLCRSSPCFSFSPTSSSILTWSANVLKVERSDDWHPSTSRTYRQYAAISYSGSRIATAREEESTVTIVDLHSQAPVQVIDTGAKIDGLIITGNVLLVATGGEKVTAWLVMGGRRLADGVVDNERASRSDSIWSTRSSRYQPDFNVEGHLGVIGGNLDSLSSTTQKPVRFSTGRTTCPDTSAVLRCTPTNKLIVENITAFVTTIYPHKTLPPKTIGWFCGSRRKRYGG